MLRRLRSDWAWLLVLVLLVGGVLFAGGCSLIEDARLYAGKGTARLVETECAFSSDQRRGNLDAINGELTARGSKARAVALDCDGDGAPDI